MTDTRPISGMVLCWPCQTPKPLDQLARDAFGIPLQLCLACAATQPAQDCEPEFAPLRGTHDLPDIAEYQEAPSA